jgi:hypothetical protein
MNKMTLLDKNQIEDLRRRLAQCRIVAQHGDEEAGTIVHALTDLEGSFRAFLNKQLPELLDPSVQGDRLEGLLMDIQQEFRVILYHIHDPQLFRVLEPTHDWLMLHKTDVG